MKIDAEEILQKIYESGINFRIDTLYPEGFFGSVSDWTQGRSVNEIEETLEKIAIKLANMVTNLWPTSEFAKWWREKNG